MLNDIEKKNSFRIPENYFQQFNADIMNRLPEKQSKKIVPLWKSVTKWTAVAAAIIGVTVIGANFLETNKPATKVTTTTETVSTLEDDYYSFIEEEATQSIYKDAFYSEN